MCKLEIYSIRIQITTFSVKKWQLKTFTILEMFLEDDPYSWTPNAPNLTLDTQPPNTRGTNFLGPSNWAAQLSISLNLWDILVVSKTQCFDWTLLYAQHLVLLVVYVITIWSWCLSMPLIFVDVIYDLSVDTLWWNILSGKACYE